MDVVEPSLELISDANGHCVQCTKLKYCAAAIEAGYKSEHVNATPANSSKLL